MSPISASAEIARDVTSWPGVQAGPGPRGEFSFKVFGREIGHLHGDWAAHFSLPKRIGVQLRAEGRVVDHPAFPGTPGLVARRIRDDDDVRDVIAILRMNYERICARHKPGLDPQPTS